MAGKPGRSGTNKNWDKWFVEALRMELLAAGPDRKKLRTIARKLIKNAEDGDMAAIKEIADRIDGKPAQEQTITMARLNAAELSDNELADIAAGGSEDADPQAVDPQITH